jgi:DNA replication protein DnaC
MVSPKQIAEFCYVADRLLTKERKVFVIDNENYDALNSFFAYFFGSQNDFETHNRNKKKGLMIVGNVGSGKSFLFDILSKFGTGRDWFKFYLCSQIQNEWANFNSKIITDTRNVYRKESGLNHIYFDDLGSEEKKSDYGVMVEPMERVIENRNLMWVRHGVKTHLSTNLSSEMIQQRYGERTLSRIIQMCNVIILGEGEESKDRRRKWM